MGNYIKINKMKFAVIALVANVSAVSLSKPLIHPQTGLAITTTGQHWYGQPPLAWPRVKETPKPHQQELTLTLTLKPSEVQENFSHLPQLLSNIKTSQLLSITKVTPLQKRFTLFLQKSTWRLTTL